MCVPQRHCTLAKACLTWASVGFGVFSSSAAALISFAFT